MSRRKALLILDPDRRQEQMAYLVERATILDEIGDQLWVSITEAQAERFAQQGIIVQFHEDADLVDLPAVVFDPAEGDPEPPAGLAAAAPQGADTAYYLVQFVAPPDAAWIAEVEETGGIYIQEIPINVVAFRLTGPQASQVDQLDFVSWVGLYHPAYALSYELAGQEEPFSGPGLRNMQVDPAQIVATETGTLEVTFFDDVASADMIPAVQAVGATIQTDTGYNLVVDIAPEQVTNLLRVPGVQAVERHVSAEEGNQRAGIIIGTDQVRSLGNVDFLVNLDGTGEIAGVIDSGFDAGGSNPPAGGDPPVHADLAGRLQFNNLYFPAVPANTADPLPHGTHVAGSIAGNGVQTAAFPGAPPANPSTIRGMAPASQVIFHSARRPVPLNPIRRDYSGFMTGLINAHNAGARVHSNSWATRASPASVITNNVYTNVTGSVDRFAFLHPESLVLFLAHNDEQDANGDGILDMRHLRQQSVAKNILCIGACENQTTADGTPGTYAPAAQWAHGNFAPFNAGPFTMSNNANHIALFSNRGRVFTPGAPAARRRVKPDLVAPGTNIISTGPAAMLPLGGAANPPNTAPPGFYYVSSGTSMATPIAAGSAVLARQYYRARFNQLRRPVLLEQVNPIVDLPTIAPHQVGCVIAWVHRDVGAGQNHIVGARYRRNLVRRDNNIVQLQTNVGDHPAPMLARHGDNTLLLHRASDNTIRLSLYDANLALVNGFGANGTVTLAPASRSEDSRPPALDVNGDEVAVVWNQTGGDNLLFQRFVANTGAAIDGAPKTLGDMTHTSPHPYVVHNGTHYAVVWMHLDGADRKLQMRLIDNSGALVGAQPITLATQAQDIRDPHLVWDSRQNRFMVVWVGSNTHPGGDIFRRFVDASGNPIGTADAIITVPAANTMRRPFVALHPQTGYVLLWEEDTQQDAAGNNRFDVYIKSLDNGGFEDFRIQDPLRPLRPIRISDTDQNTSGFTCLADASGTLPVWQSNDEINSDILGVYALNITNEGAFQAQVDPDTPLINSGRYVPHLLHQHGTTDLTAVAMVWAGGNYFLLRAEPGNFLAELHLVSTNADSLPDAAFGAQGSRNIDIDVGYDRAALYWAETQLIAAHALGPQVKIFLFDVNGNAVGAFGTNGMRAITEPAAAAITPQLGHRGRGNSLQVFVAYGRHGDPVHTLRYAVLNRQGNNVVAPRDLRPTNGTAQHGWFHWVETDTPRRSIAAWHREVGGNMSVLINRFAFNGNPVHTTDITLTALAGDSQNAVIAPRPVLFDPPVPTPAAASLNTRRREYGVAWQHRPAPGAAWEIRFSRLNRDGTVAATRDVQVVSNIIDNTDPQLVWHTNGYGLAWLEELFPGAGRRLNFTVLDQNGARVDLRAFGAPVAAPAPNHRVSSPGADVRDFQLVWNGRSFRITWTEVNNGQLRHMQTAIAVPRQAGQVGYDQPYHHPSSALIRATLINGATNIRGTTLPNFGNNPNDGYGWGRVNLRQSLAPSPPVTFQVRDDNAVGSGRTVRYRFHLPANTLLLRATLCWTDPPGVRLVNNLHLSITDPGGRVFHGNTWDAAPNTHLSRPIAGAVPFDAVHNTEQIVLQNPLPGLYSVDIIAEVIPSANPFNQFPGQPFALVFVGSGAEVAFPAPTLAPGAIPAVY